EGGKPDSSLVAEGYRQRVLQMGAPGHRRVAVPPGKFGKMAADRRQIIFEQRETGAELQHNSRIHNGLGRRSPMNGTAKISWPFGALAPERKDRIAARLGLSLQAREIERAIPVRKRAPRPRYCFACLGRNDPEPRLSAG